MILPFVSGILLGIILGACIVWAVSTCFNKRA